jgi:RimJ/RimL family protein N-acetyltransferase
VTDVLRTRRLLLVPVTPADARAVVSGPGVAAAGGWPPVDTVEGFRAALDHGGALGWFVTLDGVVVGDCGTHGEADGDLEIRYGIAPPCRGRGYATEVIGALVVWALRTPGVERVVARRVRVENVASRRALERCGFTVDEVDHRYVDYVLGNSK